MKTEKRIKRLLPLLLITLLCSALQAAPVNRAARREQRRPNFILIIADDMAWDDSGAFGRSAIRTPNIDRLARAGMRFNRAFVTTSSCSPSRASIITGRYPHSTDAEQLHWSLPAEQTTFVELLKNAGYWTAAAGKWHLGEEIKDRFDTVKEASSAGFRLPIEQSGAAAAGGQQTAASGSDGSGATEWVATLRNRPKDKPFFLWLASLDPHRNYRENIIAAPHRPADVYVPPYLPDLPEVRRDLALYYDEIARLDSYVGEVLAELERQGEADNTLMMFLSDNGRPFPRDKTTLYDSGIKTPLIAKWPGTIKAGGATNSLVSTVDIAPTITELAGLKFAPSFQGKSFVSVLKNPRSEIRDAIYAEKNWHDYEDRARAVRNARFKYIRNYYTDLPLTPPADAVRSPTFTAMRELSGQGKLTPEQMRIFTKPRRAEELYDTEKDPHELRNLVGDPKHTGTMSNFREKLKKWENETDDRPPAARTPDEFDRELGTPLPNRQPVRPGKKAIPVKSRK